MTSASSDEGRESQGMLTLWFPILNVQNCLASLNVVFPLADVSMLPLNSRIVSDPISIRLTINCGQDHVVLAQVVASWTDQAAFTPFEKATQM